MNWRDKISTVRVALARSVMQNLPLLVLWILALAAPAVGDIPKLWELEYPSLRYVLGLLRIMTCSVAFSVVVAWAIAAVARWRVLRWLLALVAFLLLGTYSFLMINYGMRLTPEFFSFIIETTHAEAVEFLSTYLSQGSGLCLIIAIVVAMVLWVIVDIRWHKRHHEPSPRASNIIAVLLLAVVVGAACAPSTWQLAWSQISSDKKHYNDAFGLDAISNIMFCQQALRHTDELTMESIAVTRKAVATPIKCRHDSTTIVLVIGESYIKSHASIYGYPLPTTPCMIREKEVGRLWAFTDAVSPFNNTNMTMRVLLSLNSVNHGEQWQHSPIVAAMFKSAGYQVDMWDNQRDFFTESDYTRGLNGFIYHPDVIKLCYSNLNNKNYTYDGEIVADYAASQASATSQPRLVIFHLRGQHIMASKRYPHSAGFDRFTVKDYSYRKEPFLTHNMLQEIAWYDNATLYNDHVMGEIFELFCKQDAVVVYLSDHGDEVYDYRPSIGRRAIDSDNSHNPDYEKMLHYQFDVPLVIWCSPLFMERHPQQVEQIAGAINRRTSIDDVGQMLLGIAGITTSYYVPEYDVINANYKAADRVVNFKLRYDSIQE